MSKENMAFRLADKIAYFEGCTISKKIFNNNDDYNISLFSLAANTNISKEWYNYSKLLIVLDGKLIIQADNDIIANVDDGYLTEAKTLVGVKCIEKTKYFEISLKENSKMNNVIKDKNIFKLKDLVSYDNNGIVNMDLISEPKFKLVLMSFDAKTGLKEHAAPGEALITALEGEGVIGYDGKEYPIQAGESFKFEKGKNHYIKADKRFKMALLLTLE